MAGFRALAEQVRDPDRAPSQRRQALRRCLERFAPYGHRATWHHLCSRAGISPEDREPDPELLVSALEELEEARDVWLAYEEEVAQRRRREKHDGIRQPTALDDWHAATWGGRSLLPCKDPTAPPDTPLAVVLRRLIQAMERAAAPPPSVVTGNIDDSRCARDGAARTGDSARLAGTPR
ncbi:hypothetical protein [Streptomyces sp. RKND-216]|uniref:hypothetical protein n=1 Tax=Streptomyces sp. RKND-216 TaxID=2562581 RepID=UPI001FFBE2F4|nr:hypothetical protein [Streptomyces sp. RKND-216]